jgi:hypothetical protein
VEARYDVRRAKNAARLRSAIYEAVLAKSSLIFWIACPSGVAFAQNITSQIQANQNVTLAVNATIDLTSGTVTYTASTGMSGTGAVEVSGTGTLVLDEINAYTLPTVTETISSIQISGSNKQFYSYEGYTTQFSPALFNGDDGGFNGPIDTLHYGSSGQPDAPAVTIDAGVDLQFGTNTDLHEGAGEVAAGDINNATSSNMNLDNALDNGTLTFTAIPPRAKFPVSVTVVAWQWGRSIDPPVQSANVVGRTFLITSP